MTIKGMSKVFRDQSLLSFINMKNVNTYRLKFTKNY